MWPVAPRVLLCPSGFAISETAISGGLGVLILRFISGNKEKKEASEMNQGLGGAHVPGQMPQNFTVYSVEGRPSSLNFFQ